MKGKLIIIEGGSDGSGKATQTKKLYQRLQSEGVQIKKVEFPNYESESSALVKMYLRGDFGKNPGDVSPYISSTFYAVDRYASFKTDWEKDYLAGTLILSDRYTTSNMVHQAAKLSGLEKDIYLDWLWQLEFQLYHLPVPDCVIFLDVPPDISQELMRARANKFTGEEEKDIHERNQEYMKNSYENAQYVANKYNWRRISCADGNRLKSIDEIHEEIYAAVLDVLHR